MIIQSMDAGMKQCGNEKKPDVKDLPSMCPDQRSVLRFHYRTSTSVVVDETLLRTPVYSAIRLSRYQILRDLIINTTRR